MCSETVSHARKTGPLSRTGVSEHGAEILPPNPPILEENPWKYWFLFSPNGLASTGVRRLQIFAAKHKHRDGLLIRLSGRSRVVPPRINGTMFAPPYLQPRSSSGDTECPCRCLPDGRSLHHIPNEGSRSITHLP